MPDLNKVTIKMSPDQYRMLSWFFREEKVAEIMRTVASGQRTARRFSFGECEIDLVISPEKSVEDSPKIWTDYEHMGPSVTEAPPPDVQGMNKTKPPPIPDGIDPFVYGW